MIHGRRSGQDGRHVGYRIMVIAVAKSSTASTSVHLPLQVFGLFQIVGPLLQDFLKAGSCFGKFRFESIDQIACLLTGLRILSMSTLLLCNGGGGLIEAGIQIFNSRFDPYDQIIDVRRIVVKYTSVLDTLGQFLQQRTR